MMTPDWIGKWAGYSPRKTAIREVGPGKDYSFAALNDMAIYTAANLHHRFGLKKGDRIAILSRFNAAFIALFGAAQKAGFILVPVNTHLTPHEVQFQIDNSGASLIVCEDAFAKKVEGNPIQTTGWKDLLKETTSRYEAAPVWNDPLFILYTSGTTGRPKGSIYTHKMLFWNSVNTGLRLDLVSSDVTLNCMPSFHTGGWNVLITPFLHHGATVWLFDEFDAGRVLKTLEESKSTLFMAVPTMLKLMSEAPEFKTVDLRNIRYFIVGGEALPIPEIEVWQTRNVPIRQGFGLTETGPNVTSLHQSDALRKRGSIGFFNFYIHARILNEAGEECAPEEVGELLLAGPNVSPGYWNNPEETAKAFCDGYFKTGDLVKRDAEGYIYVVGRKKEMYISGGENVYPREVEVVLQQHPQVAEAAVTGVPHQKWGETGAAFIIAKAGIRITEKDLNTWCSQYLAKFKIPKHYIFLKNFPRNATGKVDKTQLKEQFLKTVKSNKHENK